jgi:hypothetical protein
VPAGKDRGKHLLDDVVLPDDHLLQLLLHQLALPGELGQHLAQTTGLLGQETTPVAERRRCGGKTRILSAGGNRGDPAGGQEERSTRKGEPSA